MNQDEVPAVIVNEPEKTIRFCDSKNIPVSCLVFDPTTSTLKVNTAFYPKINLEFFHEELKS